MEAGQKKTDLSGPIPHGQHGPVWFDEVWLREYESYAGELFARGRQKRDQDEVFKEIEETVKTEGVRAYKDAA